VFIQRILLATWALYTNIFFTACDFDAFNTRFAVAATSMYMWIFADVFFGIWNPLTWCHEWYCELTGSPEKMTIHVLRIGSMCTMIVTIIAHSHEMQLRADFVDPKDGVPTKNVNFMIFHGLTAFIQPLLSTR
jgi:hypothetical protein